eukprot:1353607-Pyramimonas_sp.AAC.1
MSSLRDIAFNLAHVAACAEALVHIDPKSAWAFHDAISKLLEVGRNGRSKKGGRPEAGEPGDPSSERSVRPELPRRSPGELSEEEGGEDEDEDDDDEDDEEEEKLEQAAAAEY